MIGMQNNKIQVAVEPQTVGTSAVSGYVDTLGFNYASVYYVGGPVATGGVPGTLKIQHGDTTSAFTDVTSAVGGTDATNGFTIPTPNTDDGDIVAWQVNLDGKKRYLNLTTTGTSTARTVTGVVILSRAEQSPNSDAEAGADEVIYV